MGTALCPSPSPRWQGHAAPILYAVWAEAGFLPEAELLNLRKITSDLDGHPVPVSVRGLCPRAVSQACGGRGIPCSARYR